MRLREFEQRALEYWEEIPPEYKEGIDGIRVVAQAKPHPELPRSGMHATVSTVATVDISPS